MPESSNVCAAALPRASVSVAHISAALQALLMSISASTDRLYCSPSLPEGVQQAAINGLRRPKDRDSFINNCAETIYLCDGKIDLNARTRSALARVVQGGACKRAGCRLMGVKTLRFPTHGAG